MSRADPQTASRFEQHEHPENFLSRQHPGLDPEALSPYTTMRRANEGAYVEVRSDHIWIQQHDRSATERVYVTLLPGWINFDPIFDLI
jgi:hypothetical protein